MKVGEVLKQLAQEDLNFRTLIANGEWRAIFHKNNYVALVDEANKRTLIIKKNVIADINKNFEFKEFKAIYIYETYNGRLTKAEIERKYQTWKQKRGKLFLNGRIVKVKKPKHKTKEKKPLSEIEVLKTTLRNLKDIRQTCRTLTKGEKISLTKKIKKLEKQIYVNLAKD